MSGLDAPLYREDTVCQLRLSELGEKQTHVGTYLDDALALLGQPDARAGASDYAILSYRWCMGADCMTHAAMELTFKRLPMCFRDGGAEVSPSLWLTRVDVTSMAYPSCLDRTDAEPVACDGCISFQDVAPCAEVQ